MGFFCFGVGLIVEEVQGVGSSESEVRIIGSSSCVKSITSRGDDDPGDSTELGEVGDDIGET